MPRLRQEARLNLNHFIDGELEIADGFLSEATGFVAEGRLSAAQDSLTNVDSVAEILERYLEQIEDPQEAARYVPLINERRQKALLFRRTLPMQ